MSWKAEVVVDNDGKWAGNSLRFASKHKAEIYAIDLAYRWTRVREWRVVETDDPVDEGRRGGQEQ